MRISSNLLVQNQLAALSTASGALERSLNQVSTGKRIAKGSDDPAAASAVMANSSALNALGQYRRNIQRADAQVAAEDQVLSQVGDLLTRVREVGLSQATDTADGQTRLVAATEVEQIFNQLVALGNTQVNGEYLFGGDRGAEAPFAATGTGKTLDYTTTGATGQRAVQVGDSRAMTPTDDGNTVFISSDVLAAVRDVVVALSNPAGNQQQAITDAVTRASSAFNTTQAVQGRLGASADALQMASSNVDAFESSLTAYQSQLRDVDMEQAVTEFSTRQTAYQAALLASSKLLSLDLTQYLR